MATAFENFVNTELPKRIATNESPTTPQAGDIPVFSGVGLLTESKTASEAGLATETFATNAANTAETNAKSYADDLITSINKFQTTYNPQTTGNFPTTANTVGGVAIKKGFTWVVSGVTGQYTFRGVTVDNGDTLLALVDNASATSAADWHITEKNLGYTPENQANKVNDLTDSTSTAKYTSVKAVVDGLSGKQNTLADVITANTYGSSTQYPVITFNAKGIATGVTLQTVPTPTFTDATFKVQKNGSPAIAATWSLTALTGSHVHTYPNKDINFGDMPSVATTNSNTLSSTAVRCSILGGQSNNVGGTDNVILASSNCAVSSTQCTIIGSTAVTLAGTAQRNVTVCNVVLDTNRSFTFPSGTLVTGSSASVFVAHIKTFSAFRLSKPDSATVLVQDVNNVKPYAVFNKYNDYHDVGLHRVTVIGALNANNYTVRNVLVRRNFGVTVTTIEAGGGYITLSAAQNGDRLDLTVGTTYTNTDTLTVFVESYYTDVS